MKIETLEVSGFIPAMKGMRNAMNSWDKMDTYITKKEVDYYFPDVIMGKNDLELAQKLITAGGEHSKFMRMIQVWADVDMPRYYHSEADTYKFNTKNSCSTMHRLLHPSTKITKEMFVYNEIDEDVIEIILKRLNCIRRLYLVNLKFIKETDDKELKKSVINDNKELVRRAKQLLPEGFLQLRTINTNYAELRNMYFQRRNHRLCEWSKIFVEWIHTLPYSAELITYESGKK